MPPLKPEFTNSMPLRFQSMENIQVILKLMNHILQNDTVNIIQFRVVTFKLWQNVILENLVLKAIVVDGTAFIEAAKKFGFYSFAWIKPETMYLNHSLLCASM